MVSAPRRARRVAPALVLAASFAACALASERASADSPTSQADMLFAEGRELLEKGRYAEACAKLNESEELAPAVGTLLNLGYCWEQLGRLKSAMDAYAHAEALAGSASDTKRASLAHDRFAAVEKKAPKLIVRVTPQDVSDLTITRNGVALAKSDLDRPVAVDPEDYVIAASAPGHPTWKSAVIVRGEGAVVTVIVPSLASMSAANGGAGRGPGLGARRVMALGLEGLGALALGAGIATAVSAKSRYDESSPHCDATGCDAVGVGIQERAAAQGNIATLLVTLGVLSVGAGIYLWIVGAPPAHDPSKSATLLGGRF